MPELVRIYVERKVKIWVDAPLPEYYHLGDGVWVGGSAGSDRATDDYMLSHMIGNDDDYIWTTHKMGEEIFVMFASTMWPEGLLEQCVVPVGLTYDPDATEMTLEELNVRMTMLAAHMQRGAPLQAEGAPYIHNKSGNPNYNDPEWRYPDFICMLDEQERDDVVAERMLLYNTEGKE